ncbi:hypothetical protein ACFC0U_35110, partial [Streptomyces anulatus]
MPWSRPTGEGGRALTVVDDLELAVAVGALGNSGPGADAAPASLGQVLRGERAGRERNDQITVSAPVGLPWQDLAPARPVYRAGWLKGPETRAGAA